MRESVGVPFVDAGRILVKILEFSRSGKAANKANGADWSMNPAKTRVLDTAARSRAEIRILKWPVAAGRVNVSGPGTY